MAHPNLVSAISRACAKIDTCILPIVADYEASNYRTTVGTGTLFHHLGRHFVVTARHVVEALTALPAMDAHWAIPDAVAGGNLWFVGTRTYVVIKGDVDDLDIGVIELGSPELVEEVSRRRRFLEIGEIEEEGPWNGDAVLIYGYPRVRCEDKVHRFVAGRFIGVSVPYQGTLTPGETAYNPRHHILLNGGKDTMNGLGLPSQAPELDGVSGSPIWSVPWDDPAKLVHVERQQLRAAGVFTTAKRDWLKGTKWKIVRAVVAAHVRIR